MKTYMVSMNEKEFLAYAQEKLGILDPGDQESMISRQRAAAVIEDAIARPPRKPRRTKKQIELDKRADEVMSRLGGVSNRKWEETAAG